MWTIKPFTLWPRCARPSRASFLLGAAFALAVLTFVLLATSGCANFATVVDSISKDTNSVSVKVTTTFGNLDYRRNTDK